MILGLSIHTYTQIHTIISLIGIASGFVVVIGLLSAKRMNGWTALFLATTIATSVTGFGFPIHKIGPPHIVGAISLVVLAIALVARYAFHLNGTWRSIYVITAVMALYLNVFVGVVQAFQKIPALHALAPTQKEPPFAIAQLSVLIIFIVLGTLATRSFRRLATA